MIKSYQKLIELMGCSLATPDSTVKYGEEEVLVNNKALVLPTESNLKRRPEGTYIFHPFQESVIKVNPATVLTKEYLEKQLNYTLSYLFILLSTIYKTENRKALVGLTNKDLELNKISFNKVKIPNTTFIKLSNQRELIKLVIRNKTEEHRGETVIMFPLLEDIRKGTCAGKDIGGEAAINAMLTTIQYIFGSKASTEGFIVGWTDQNEFPKTQSLLNSVKLVLEKTNPVLEKIIMALEPDTVLGSDYYYYDLVDWDKYFNLKDMVKEIKMIPGQELNHLKKEDKPKQSNLPDMKVDKRQQQHSIDNTPPAPPPPVPQQQPPQAYTPPPSPPVNNNGSSGGFSLKAATQQYQHLPQTAASVTPRQMPMMPQQNFGMNPQMMPPMMPNQFQQPQWPMGGQPQMMMPMMNQNPPPPPIGTFGQPDLPPWM